MTIALPSPPREGTLVAAPSPAAAAKEARAAARRGDLDAFRASIYAWTPSPQRSGTEARGIIKAIFATRAPSSEKPSTVIVAMVKALLKRYIPVSYFEKVPMVLYREALTRGRTDVLRWLAHGSAARYRDEGRQRALCEEVIHRRREGWTGTLRELVDEAGFAMSRIVFHRALYAAAAAAVPPQLEEGGEDWREDAFVAWCVRARVRTRENIRRRGGAPDGSRRDDDISRAIHLFRLETIQRLHAEGATRWWRRFSYCTLVKAGRVGVLLLKWMKMQEDTGENEGSLLEAGGGNELSNYNCLWHVAASDDRDLLEWLYETGRMRIPPAAGFYRTPTFTLFAEGEKEGGAPNCAEFWNEYGDRWRAGIFETIVSLVDLKPAVRRVSHKEEEQ